MIVRLLTCSAALAAMLSVSACSIQSKPVSEFDGLRPNRAAAVNDQNAHAHYNLGRIALDEARRSDAISAFRRARTVQPEFEEAWNGEGIALLDGESYGAAAKHYAAMAEALPKSVLAVEGQAAAALGLRKLDEAKAFADAAIARDPRSSQGFRLLGEVAYIRGEYTLALENWKRAVELNPALDSSLRPVMDDLTGYLRKYGAEAHSTNRK